MATSKNSRQYFVRRRAGEISSGSTVDFAFNEDEKNSGMLLLEFVRYGKGQSILISPQSNYASGVDSSMSTIPGVRSGLTFRTLNEPATGIRVKNATSDSLYCDITAFKM